MPGDDDGDGAPEHKGHLPPFTPPRFSWNRTICTNNLKASSKLWSSHSEDNMRTAQMALSEVQS